MKFLSNYFGRQAQKIRNLFLMMVYGPIIGYRYVVYSLKRKPLLLHGFSCSTKFCIEGTLNSLQWHVENALFVRLNNYPILRLGKQEKIFSVLQGNDEFELECFGIKERKSLFVKLTIIKMKPKDFDEVKLISFNREINFSGLQWAQKKSVFHLNKSIEIKSLNTDLELPKLEIEGIKTNELSQKLNNVKKTKTLLELTELKNHI